jgi:hypothetical protein
MKKTFMATIMALVWMCTESGIAASGPTAAGQGEYVLPIIIPSPSNTNDMSFERYQNYVRVSVVSWYLNRQGNIWTDLMASGTCEAKVGDEDYNIALGTFELAGGAHMAPIVDKVVVDNRLWQSGDLEIKLFLQANKQDTALASVLKELASSSMGVASSAAVSYGSQLASGPYAPLVSAGQTMIKSVQDLLGQGPKPLPIFEVNNGFDYTKQLRDFHGGVNYILFFRGNANLVTPAAITIREDNGGPTVLANGAPLLDGAWMLVKVENNTVYDKARPWEADAHKLRTDIKTLMQLFSAGLITSSNALKQLEPSSTDDIIANQQSNNQTLGDRWANVDNEIAADSVISYVEQSTGRGKNDTVWTLALEACRSNDPTVYTKGISALHAGLAAGTTPNDTIVRTAFTQSFGSVATNLNAVMIERGATPAVNPAPTESSIWNKSSEVIKAKTALGNADPL